MTSSVEVLPVVLGSDGNGSRRRSAAPVLLDGHAADAPVLERDLVDHHEGRGGLLVEDAHERVGDGADEFALLGRRRALARDPDVHVGHGYHLPACAPPSTCRTSPETYSAPSR